MQNDKLTTEEKGLIIQCINAVSVPVNQARMLIDIITKLSNQISYEEEIKNNPSRKEMPQPPKVS